MKRILFFLVVPGFIILSAACAGTTQTQPFATATALTPLVSPTTTMIPTLATAGTPTRVNTATASPSPTTTVKIEAQPSATPTAQGGPSPTVMTDPQLQQFINDAKADLANVANIPVDSITLKSVTPQEWPNAALGCPLPGIFYIQVITPGYIIMLTGGGRDWEYHAGGNRVELCER